MVQYPFLQNFTVAFSCFKKSAYFRSVIYLKVFNTFLVNRLSCLVGVVRSTVILLGRLFLHPLQHYLSAYWKWSPGYLLTDYNPSVLSPTPSVVFLGVSPAYQQSRNAISFSSCISFPITSSDSCVKVSTDNTSVLAYI
ncbi:hypothetical protein DPMN_120927 [Dreissena polymorpha]|uniref:Uncharacterized protein n=1 Tax=Dreissena polymorpha TaxID=45954 RepID=A0A9D4GPI5_DREPO|nr:hypothetical protein DPMN_120927 [Dreissena polymorpha]